MRQFFFKFNKPDHGSPHKTPHRKDAKQIWNDDFYKRICFSSSSNSTERNADDAAASIPGEEIDSFFSVLSSRWDSAFPTVLTVVVPCVGHDLPVLLFEALL